MCLGFLSVEEAMSNYKSLTVVGEKIEDDFWPDVEKEIDEINESGMNVIKIINYKEGSTKYIASVSPGLRISKIRPKLELLGWKLLSPYYSHGKIIGFKVAKDRESKDVNAWGGV
jgi:hypothetical protein